MDKKLLYHLISQIEWKSLLKGFSLFILLLFLKTFGFTFIFVGLFFIIAFILYIMESSERKIISISYLFLIISSILVILALPDKFNIWFIASFLYGLLFFIMFSFINFHFRNRVFIYPLINTISIFSFFLAINTISFFNFHSFWSILEIFIVFIGLKLFIREYILFSIESFGKKESLISGVFALLGLEFLWIFQFLPLGIINASALLAIFISILRDFIPENYKKTLKTSFILKQITFFVIILLIFLAISPWRI